MYVLFVIKTWITTSISSEAQAIMKWMDKWRKRVKVQIFNCRNKEKKEREYAKQNHETSKK